MADFIRDFLDAFIAANPDRPVPELVQEGAWVYLTYSDMRYRTPYRRKKIIDMTRVLRERVANSPLRETDAAR